MLVLELQMDYRHTASGMKPVLFLLPVFFIMAAVIVFPVFDTVRLSFFNATFLKPGLTAPFTGLKNYTTALSTELFWQSFGITLWWAFGSIVFQFILGFYLALLFNARAERIRNSGFLLKILRSLFLIPWMVPGSLAAIIWKWMYHGSVGLVNTVLLGLGIIHEVKPWLASADTVVWSCLVVNIWRGIPFQMVMLLGGLQTIPKQYYEAAKIDGASAVRSFFQVTIPYMRSLIITLVIFGFMGAFNFLDIILVLTRGGPANHSMVLPLYAWLTAFFENRIGYSASISVLMCVILAMFGMGISFFRRDNE